MYQVELFEELNLNLVEDMVPGQGSGVGQEGKGTDGGGLSSNCG